MRGHSPLAKIDAVSCCLARVPLDTTTSFATRTVTGRDYVLVKVRTDDGHTGIGFCYAGHHGGEHLALAIRELLAPLLIGREPGLVEETWQLMYQETLLQGRTGSVMRGLSALDIALWDRNARAAGLPLHRFLGAYGRNESRRLRSQSAADPGRRPFRESRCQLAQRRRATRRPSCHGDRL